MAEYADDGYGYDKRGDKDPENPPSYSPGGHSAYPPPQAGYPPPQAGYPLPAQPVTGQPMMSSSNTTVVLQQPAGPQVVMPRTWSTGICSCFDDMSVCMCGLCCGCCLATEVAKDMDEHCCVPCCVPGWLTALRLKMRTQENIQGTLMNDCCTVAWCGSCALCQMAREIKLVKMRRQAGLSMQPSTIQY